MNLFITGFIQVFFIAINTYFLSKGIYFGVGFASFMISIVWSLNVKKIAFGNWIDRILYASGAMSGSLTGLFISQLNQYL